MYKDPGGILRGLSELNAGHNERYVSLYVDLKGLHGCNELGDGCDIDTTENLEVHEGYAQKSVELFANVGFVTESTGSFFSGNILMTTEFDIESVIGTTEA